MPQVWANGASGRLATSITTGSVSATLEAGQGALFPAPAAGEFMLLSFESAAGVREYIRCESRTGDVLTLTTRAQEGSSLFAFPASSRVEIRTTAGGLNKFLQADAGVLQAALNAATFNITNIGTASGITADFDNFRGATYRANDNGTANQLVIPDGAGAPTIAGSVVVTVANAAAQLVSVLFPAGGIVAWSGSIVSIPAGWLLCNGASGTPDLRDRFIVGAGSSYAVGVSGGSILATTSLTDATVTVAIAGHVLTEAQMPLHGHPLRLAPLNANSAGSDLTGGINLLNTLHGGAPSNYAAFTGVPTDVAGQQLGGTGGSASHGHSGSTAATTPHAHTVDPRPPYYALAWIMKT